ncbi:chaperone NapD [Maricurvus nonylphenolicus]|uniref:chaperone NapD n=1 Tax=Maricurvus nonylphenolicus TaxID=1008307 RepID=UPI0036F1FE8E
MIPADQHNNASPPEWHVASLVVYCQPEQFLQLRQQIEAMPNAEVHTDDNHAKLVVTVEGNSTAELSEHMDTIRLLEGTLSVQMVFHQQDDTSTLAYAVTE